MLLENEKLWNQRPLVDWDLLGGKKQKFRLEGAFDRIQGTAAQPAWRRGYLLGPDFHPQVNQESHGHRLIEHLDDYCLIKWKAEKKDLGQGALRNCDYQELNVCRLDVHRLEMTIE